MCDLLDLKSDQCRYPSGDATPYDFCGKPKVRGAYCAAHAKLCYLKSSGKPWESLAGMIYATEHTILHTSNGSRTSHRGQHLIDQSRVSPIDKVFANSQIGEKPLMERVL